MVIGITGGIGSGKSTVCRLLGGMGIPVIDADRIGRDALEDEAVRSLLQKEFGQDIIINGAVSKPALAERAFVSEEAQQRLNGVTHPFIIKKITEEIDTYSKKYDIIALELPLLYECGLEWLCDEVWVVYAPEETRLRRLLKRGMSPADAANRLRLQMSLEEKARRADFVIDNTKEGCSLQGEIAGRISFYKQ